MPHFVAAAQVQGRFRRIWNAPMSIVHFINDASTAGKILYHIGESIQPPRIASARGPPLWGAATPVSAVKLIVSRKFDGENWHGLVCCRRE
jgi:hypothetical protein